MNKERIFEKPTRHTLNDLVYEQIRDAIVKGFYAPGEKITIRELESELDVSVMPIRIALQRLVAEGALYLDKRRSVRVPNLSSESFAELIELRLMLEGRAAELAAKQITKDELKTLKELIKRDKTLCKSGTSRELGEVNMAFHFTIYQAARTHHLFRMIETLWLKIGPLLNLPFRADAAGRKEFLVQKFDEGLLSALSQGKGREAKKLVCDGILYAADWYKEHHNFADG